MLERHDKNDTHLSKIKKVMPKTKDGWNKIKKIGEILKCFHYLVWNVEMKYAKTYTHAELESWTFLTVCGIMERSEGGRGEVCPGLRVVSQYLEDVGDRLSVTMVSYSITTAIVYGVSGSIFFFLIFLLILLGLEPALRWSENIWTNLNGSVYLFAMDNKRIKTVVL